MTEHESDNAARRRVSVDRMPAPVATGWRHPLPGASVQALSPRERERLP
jgi:hypothetical protein